MQHFILTAILSLFLLTSSQILDDEWTHPPPLPVFNDYKYCNTSSSKRQCQNQTVCGFRAAGLPITFVDGCQACRNPNIIAYLLASCENSLRVCPRSRLPRGECQKMGKMLSCGFQNQTVPKDMGDNLCCEGTAYTHSILGACPIIPKKSCRNLKRPICPKIYVPVCGKITNTTQQTFDNACLACNRGAFEYSEGKCPL